MANYNRVIIAGNLTKDPELRYIPSGEPVANFTVAINRNYTTKAGERKEETSFIPVVVWRKQAETCNQYLKKGSPALVEGRLQQRSWETQEGQKRTIIEVVADRVVFLGGAKPIQDEPEDEYNSESQRTPEPAHGATEDVPF
ncbi:MAG: single-stranded DNA-binding protein [bacterium]|nr:single-stranded DNA-binding protein [bacterium]